ncbi:MAG: inositol monophosphatase [Bacteroidales bacterium]|nr:inositol monophosphatase [Bacteroidales bacterium]
MMNAEKLCLKSCEIIEQVAEFIIHEWNVFSWQDVETKGLHNFVTYIDKKSEEQLVNKLSNLLPNSTFLTEEETIEQQKSTTTWIIDPLDGTTNYIHRLPPVAISVALYEENMPKLGIIYEISQKECFYTWGDGKAFLNNKQIFVSSRNAIKDGLIATGFPYYDYSRLLGMHQSLEYFFKHSHGVRRLGSAATDLAYVACGRFEAFYEYGLNPWDVAAGAFLVQQAGGNVSDFKGGNDFLYGKEIIATNALVYDEFLKLIQKFFCNR